MDAEIRLRCGFGDHKQIVVFKSRRDASEVFSGKIAATYVLAGSVVPIAVKDRAGAAILPAVQAKQFTFREIAERRPRQLCVSLCISGFHSRFLLPVLLAETRTAGKSAHAGRDLQNAECLRMSHQAHWVIQSARPDTQLNPTNREVEVRTPSPHEVTGLLDAWSQGDQAALDKLTPLVYEDLRRRAHGYMKRQSPDHTLQTTALVNEAYLKLV